MFLLVYKYNLEYTKRFTNIPPGLTTTLPEMIPKYVLF